ncbi:MAG: flagellar hook-basal body protein [Planctomycetota bacterium]
MQVGLYESAASIQAYSRSLDTLSFNLSHTATPRFKRRISTMEAFSMELQIAGNKVPIPTTRESVDFAPGALIPTGNELDLAISGKGFYKIETPEGIRYTRGGSFFQGPDGTIKNSQGERLLINGAVPKPGDPISINSSGEVSQANNPTGAKIPIYDFADYTQLVPEAGGRFNIDPSLEGPATGTITPGFVEQSNMSSVDALVGLVSLNRSFESSTRAMKTLDEIMQRTTTAV